MLSDLRTYTYIRLRTFSLFWIRRLKDLIGYLPCSGFKTSRRLPEFNQLLDCMSPANQLVTNNLGVVTVTYYSRVSRLLQNILKPLPWVLKHLTLGLCIGNTTPRLQFKKTTKIMMWIIVTVMNASKAAAKRKPEKKSGLLRIWTHGLRDTSAALYQRSQTGNWSYC